MKTYSNNLLSGVPLLTSITISVGLLALPDVLRADCVPPPAGLVAWWPGQGNADDVVGTNNGTVGTDVRFVSAKVGFGFQFTITPNSYVALPNSPAFQPSSNALTIEAWVKPDFSVGNLDDTILIKRDGCAGTFPYVFGVRKAAYGTVGNVFLSIAGRTPGAGFDSLTRMPDDGQFHHVAATFDGNAASNNCVLYLDGEIAGGGTAPGPIPLASSAPVIGADLGCGDYSAATVDELAFYNRALSPSEIAAIYTAGSAGKCQEEQIRMFIRISQVEICWTSQSNATYQLQYRSALTTNEWLPLLDCIRATNSTTCYFDAILPGQPQRYYRAVLTNCVPGF